MGGKFGHAFRFLLPALLVTGSIAFAAEPKLSATDFRQLALDPLLPAFEGCEKSTPGKPLVGSAPAILPALVGRWVTEFKRLCRLEVRVPPPFGPPLADRNPQLRRFIEGRSDFAFLTRGMSQADLARYRRFHSGNPLVIPVVGGSYRHFGLVDTLVVIVDRANPVESLSLQQIGSIFFEPAAGARLPRYWADLDPRLPRRPIHVVGSAAWRQVESARAEFLRRRLAENGIETRAWRTDVPVTGLEADVPALVAADVDAIGFTGFGHIVPGDKPVSLSLRTGGSALAPSYRNVALGRYPLERTIDLVASVPAGSRLDPRLCTFVHFLLSRTGQAIVRSQRDFLPLRYAQANRSRALLARFC